MTFAAPLFLLAALAGVVPVVLHLIHRRKAKEVPFSTLRFLKISVQRTRRRKYIEDMALLILRVAVLLLIALGLARPAISSLSALWGGGRSAAVAIVLDNSASMATIDSGHPRFETARQAAQQVIARLREGDLVALLPTGGPRQGELGRLYRAHETVRQALDECKPSFERADLAAKIQQARGLLKEADAPSKEIYVFTDNQTLSWEGLTERIDEDKAGNRQSAVAAPVIVVNVAREPAPNVALQTIALDSPAPVAGAPFQATVEVLNTATVPQQKHLELVVDDIREAVSPTLNIAPGASVKQEFRFTFDRAGAHRGLVRLTEEDGSPMDNKLYFAVTVDQQIPVAIIKPRLDLVPEADDAFYLERALAPAGPAVGAFQVTTLAPESLATAKLVAQAVVFCVNLPAPPPPAAEKLWEYVKGGGHLVWICGRNVQPMAYNTMNALAQGELLPATLDDMRQPLPGGVESWHIGFLDKDNPALGPLTEPASLYQSVLVYKYFPLKWSTLAAPRVLAKLDDGQALLTERTVGQGAVLFLGTAVHVDWTNLPLKPLFLPMVARLTFHLAG
ncbi:MAG TPA: BatA domain-containing protein, partial [Isosphaeraceae bacterium]|nr:BatA domain-containing protein [Isosphaeraceae bacterium]